MKARPREEGTFSDDVITRFYTYGKTYDVTCQVEGHPVNTSSHRWHFQPCNSFYNCRDQHQEINLVTSLRPVIPLLNPSLAFNFSSTHVVTATESGQYSCSVHSCNSAKELLSGKPCNHSQRATLEFFVSDFDGGFDIKGT